MLTGVCGNSMNFVMFPGFGCFLRTRNIKLKAKK